MTVASLPRILLPAGAATPGKPKLLDQLRMTIRAQHYSLQTEEAYVHSRTRVAHRPRRETSHSRGPDCQARHLPHLPPFVCHSLAGRWLRHSHDPGTPGPQGREHDDDLYARAKPRRARCTQSARWFRRAGKARVISALFDQFGPIMLGKEIRSLAVKHRLTRVCQTEPRWGGLALCDLSASLTR